MPARADLFGSRSAATLARQPQLAREAGSETMRFKVRGAGGF